MKKLISVIIPAYNIEQYIERCLESVCGQTYSRLEIIVIDDGSSDSTGNIIDELARKDSRIITIHKENGGVSAARNTGLDIAKGDYIGFVDGDDIIESDMYELLLRNALKYQADISHCGYQMVFPNRVDHYYNTGEVKIQNQYEGVYDLVKADKVEPGLWNKLYKRELVSEHRLDNKIKINEDLLYNYIMFKEAKNSVFEDVSKYCYMKRNNSASTSKVSKNRLEDPLLVLQKMMKQETGETYQLLEKRYAYLLEKVASMKSSKLDDELVKICRKRRDELRSIIKSHELKANYTKKEMFQLKLAAYCPVIYRLLNAMYASLTGSRNRYKV